MTAAAVPRRIEADMDANLDRRRTAYPRLISIRSRPLRWRVMSLAQKGLLRTTPPGQSLLASFSPPCRGAVPTKLHRSRPHRIMAARCAMTPVSRTRGSRDLLSRHLRELRDQKGHWNHQVASRAAEWREATRGAGAATTKCPRWPLAIARPRRA